MKNSILIHNVTSDDLKEIISDVINEKLDNLTISQPEAHNYLTRQEASQLLRISLPTLLEYTNKGHITGCRIGNRVLYRRDQIEASLEEIRTIKDRRA